MQLLIFRLSLARRVFCGVDSLSIQQAGTARRFLLEAGVGRSTQQQEREHNNLGLWRPPQPATRDPTRNRSSTRRERAPTSWREAPLDPLADFLSCCFIETRLPSVATGISEARKRYPPQSLWRFFVLPQGSEQQAK